MKRFAQSEDGFVYVMVLLFIPVLLAVALLVIDVGRGNNAHSDLYAAADALALAGARELDGGVDAVERAKDAMSQLTNTVNMLAPSGEDVHIDLTSTGDDSEHFQVRFLRAIPEQDEMPIDAAWLAAHALTDEEEADPDGPQSEAQYVWVHAKSGDNHPLRPLFAVLPIVQPVPVAATAVAMARSAACDVTPLYICNPFEGDGIIDLQTAFAHGDLHGRLFKLHPPGNETERPGNFGFLEVKDDPGADAIRDIFAGDENQTCYESGHVTTKPGASTSIRQGINVRFDIYETGGYKPEDYRPAENVRKDYVPKNENNPDPCKIERWEDDDPNDDEYGGFPDNDEMVPPTLGVPGATVGEGNWDVNQYWQINHGSSVLPTDMYQSFTNTAGPGAIGPSRYDVYRYEIDNNLLADVGAWGPGTENGLPLCRQSAVGVEPPPSEDRRIIFAAIIDCLAEAGQGKTVFAVNSYASLFMVSPMAKDPSTPSGDSTIDVEIIDITGYGGNGTLDTFVRDEAVLVR